MFRPSPENAAALEQILAVTTTGWVTEVTETLVCASIILRQTKDRTCLQIGSKTPSYGIIAFEKWSCSRTANSRSSYERRVTASP